MPNNSLQEIAVSYYLAMDCVIEREETHRLLGIFYRLDDGSLLA